MAFKLHSQLEADSHLITKLSLSQLRIIDDRRFPWLMLVPALPDLKEFHELDEPQSRLVLEEIRLCSVLLEHWVKPFKVNIGMLGNLVAQLHIHIIARFENDLAWPGPVWGSGPMQRYEPDDLKAIIHTIQDRLSELS